MADWQIASCIAHVRPLSLIASIPLIEAVTGSAVSARNDSDKRLDLRSTNGRG